MLIRRLFRILVINQIKRLNIKDNMSMKYIKSFALLGVMALFAACSSDDASYNSNESVTLGFSDTEIVKKENVGYFNVPISIVGQRDGDISLDIEVIEEGVNPAKEDVNYIITTKHLQLPCDTATTSTLSVQIKTVDDGEINDNRQFKLKIVNVQGAKLKNDQVAITLRDNDAAFYEKFFGEWKLACKDYKGIAKEYNVTISGATDEDNPDYDKYLYVSIEKIISGLSASTYFEYSFDKATLKGSLAFDLMNTVEPIASYASYNSKWCWINFDPAGAILEEPISCEWSADENSAIPTTLEFTTNGGTLGYYEYFSQDPDYEGVWGYYTDIVLTRKN